MLLQPQRRKPLLYWLGLSRVRPIADSSAIIVRISAAVDASDRRWHKFFLHVTRHPHWLKML